MNGSAVPLFPGGPRVYVIAEPLRTGNSIGVLFLPCGQCLVEERIGNCSLLFFASIGGGGG